jgi:hypothetical protein
MVDLPLTEFDSSTPALMSPRPPVLDQALPQRLVMCFFLRSSLPWNPATGRTGSAGSPLS